MIVKTSVEFVPDVVYDAAGAVEGRLASIVAKSLIEGKKVAVVNVEQAVISKPIDSVVKWLEPWYSMRTWINPRRHSPKKYVTPEGYFRTSVRNMLPVSQMKGREAYSRLRVYAGSPAGLRQELEKPDSVRYKGKAGHFTTLAQLAGYYRNWRSEVFVVKGE